MFPIYIQTTEKQAKNRNRPTQAITNMEHWKNRNVETGTKKQGKHKMYMGHETTEKRRSTEIATCRRESGWTYLHK